MAQGGTVACPVKRLEVKHILWDDVVDDDDDFESLVRSLRESHRQAQAHGMVLKVTSQVIEEEDI